MAGIPSPLTLYFCSPVVGLPFPQRLFHIQYRHFGYPLLYLLPPGSCTCSPLSLLPSPLPTWPSSVWSSSLWTLPDNPASGCVLQLYNEVFPPPHPGGVIAFPFYLSLFFFIKNTSIYFPRREDQEGEDMRRTQSPEKKWMHVVSRMRMPWTTFKTLVPWTGQAVAERGIRAERDPRQKRWAASPSTSGLNCI